jgi:hypothetical protein
MGGVQCKFTLGAQVQLPTPGWIWRFQKVIWAVQIVQIPGFYTGDGTAVSTFPVQGTPWQEFLSCIGRVCYQE